jgi:dihydroxyacetone kinase-like predicted kinase
MGECAANVTAAEVTRAVRDSSSDVGPIAAGDWLGIAADGIRAVEPDLASACTVLLGAIITAEHEILTLIEGDGATAAVTRQLTAWASEQFPDLAVEVHQGGQPLYPYLIGIE